MTVSFDVWKEPWIPVLNTKGTIEEKGIRDCLCSSHELEAIVDPSPLIQFGLYRLLIVMLMDIYDSLTANRPYDFILDLLEEGRFCPDKIDDYYNNRVGPSRFDLFDETYPFLQSAFNEEYDAEDKPVSYLLHHQPSGTNVIHFHHVFEGDLALSPVVCARALCTFQPFITTGGRGNAPSINGVPPLYVLVKGRSLFETLCLNTVWGQPDERFSGAEPVSWRSLKEVVPGQERDTATYLEGLTWRPRRVRLIPSDGGVCTYSNQHSSTLVRRMNFSAGFTARLKGAWVDPNAASIITNKDLRMMTPKEDREIWRDVGPLLLLHENDYSGKREKIRYEKPLVLRQYEQLKRELPDMLKTEVYGLRTDSKNKYFEWVYEPLHIPMAYDADGSKRGLVQKVMETTDQVCNWLGIALKKLAPASSEARSYIITAQRMFWDIAREPFFELLDSMSASLDDVNIEELMMREWKKRLSAICNRALQEALQEFSETGRDLMRQAEARQVFWGNFQRLFKVYSENEQKGVTV